MKLRRFFSLITLFSTSLISTSTLIAYSLKNDQNHTQNNQTNNSQKTIIDDLNTIIQEIKNKINLIDTKIGAILKQKQHLQTQLDMIVQENMSKITKLNERIEQIDKEITRLEGEKNQYKQEAEAKQQELQEIQKKLNSSIQQINTYKEVVIDIWNKKTKDTIWAGETYSNLLDRFNKTISLKFELKDTSQANNKINDGGDKKFKVKKGEIELELEMGKIYKNSQSKVEQGDKLIEFGWSAEGRIEKMSDNISEVPEYLPWFITSLDYAFYKSRSTFIINLEKWDTSNVKSMEGVFEGSNFDYSIANWNIENVVNFKRMFFSASNFKQSIKSWRIKKIVRGEGIALLDFINKECPIWRHSLNHWRLYLPELVVNSYRGGNRGVGFEDGRILNP
ncbi:BspA family leucine-rich repeat surface protein [Mycoplasma cottewii]|uniref:BspA family leucine-rich repeat surface protein n=1 Tax=Mycoplasma cottewii TaxID=51364 RepID=A0ABY5TVM3_9MOLU|nr:BspA family leucine-rich repeat surface protein [Mycoplasma cottewii]UWD34697.1 BspA family leucine-rich repeat surface protein [Mycoplasma cottewii]